MQGEPDVSRTFLRAFLAFSVRVVDGLENKGEWSQDAKGELL